MVFLLCYQEGEITGTPDRITEPRVCRSQFISQGIYEKNKTPVYTAPMQPQARTGTATRCDINRRCSICRNQLQAAGRRRCNHYVDLVFPLPVADNGKLGNRLESFLRSYAGRVGVLFVSLVVFLFVYLFENCLVFLIKSCKKSWFMGLG